MPFGTITLQRFNGIETYPIVSAQMMLYETEKGFCLNLEIESDENGTKTTSDTAEYPAAPNAEVSIYRKDFDLNNLVGQRYTVDSAYDDDLDDWVSRFYYYEHEGIDDNVIQFLEHNADGRYRVRWTGKTMDPNFYDGSKPQTILQIDAHFMLRE